MSPAYIIALDVGERRIGVALASTIARLPARLPTIDRTAADAVETIKKYIEENDVNTLVVGLPRGMDGQETDQTRSARLFADQLEKATGLPVVMQEETATSIAAEERLKTTGKPYVKGDIDAEAAIIILHDYLAGIQGERLA